MTMMMNGWQQFFAILCSLATGLAIALLIVMAHINDVKNRSTKNNDER